VDAGSSVALVLDTPARAGLVTVSGTTWSAQLSGLVKGANTLTVTASNPAGTSASVKGVITLLLPPALTLNPVQTPTASAVQTISGTVDPGLTPVVVVGTAASVGPVLTSAGGTVWNCTISGLAVGANPITVVASDAAGNLTVRTASLSYVPSDGDMNLDGKVDISDALGTLRIAVGILQPSAEQKLHADVAPLVNGVPAPDGTIDVADALQILRKVVGIINF